MRFEQPVSNIVARFPELRVHDRGHRIPLVTERKIAEGIARGRRLHAQFCRQAAAVVIVRPLASAARYIARLVTRSLRAFDNDRARRETIHALRALDDRVLRDIGIERGDIPHIATVLTYGRQRVGTAPAAPRATAVTEVAFEHARAA